VGLNRARCAIEDGDIETMLSTEEIQSRVEELGVEISEDFAGQELHVVGVLKGSFVFLSDLVREIELPMSIDFLGLSSYGSSTESSGVVRMTRDLSMPIEGKDVLIVEDIVDTGLTMNYLLENLETRHPASLSVCTFLNKPANREVEVPIDYEGFSISDRFVVGYGLDYAQRYRNLPKIGVVPDEETSFDGND